MLSKSDSINQLFYREIIFKKQVGLYLIFSKEKELYFSISVKKDEIFEEIISFFKILNKTAQSINFIYYFQINNEKFSFIELYYYLLKKYQFDTQKAIILIEDIILKK